MPAVVDTSGVRQLVVTDAFGTIERLISGYFETSPRIGVRPDAVQVLDETL
jgi:hypothetical protein